MASYGRCLWFFFFSALCFSPQTDARDSTMFSKFSHKPSTKTTQEVSSPTKSQAPAPAAESEQVVVEQGYGLYGKESYRYPPTTTDPAKTGLRAGEKRFVSLDEIRNGYGNRNGNGEGYGSGKHAGEKRFVSLDEIRNGYGTEKQGMSDTRFLENGKYYYDINQDVKVGKGNGYGTEKQGMSEHVEEESSYPRNNGNGNGYVTEKQGMSDTRFLENGRYYYDINQEENRYKGNGYVTEKQGVSGHVMDEPETREKWNENGNGNEYGTEKHVGEKRFVSLDEIRNKYGNGYGTEKQGMSDTRFLENGRYYYDINKDVKDENRYKGNGYVNEKQGMSEYVMDENSYPENKGNGNGYGYGNGYVPEKQGIGQMRFFQTEEEMNENENYKKSNNYYNNNYANEGHHSIKNEYENGYNENERYEGNNGYMKQGRRGYHYNPNEYVTQGREEYNGNTKKLPPNQYDTMEEYEKEEEHRLSQQYHP